MAAALGNSPAPLSVSAPPPPCRRPRSVACSSAGLTDTPTGSTRSPVSHVAVSPADTPGTIEVVILQPMLYCKNATQQGLPLTLNPAVLYRGIAVSIGNMAVSAG